MSITFLGILAILGMLGAMLLIMEIGRQIGKPRAGRDMEAQKPGAIAVDGAVFGLMGLLIAFTFYGAAGRLDVRRQLMVEECNDIGTAWLRLDLLPPATQGPWREKFKKYVETRIAVYQKMTDMDAVNVELARGTAQQNEIWSEAVSACRTSESQTAGLLLLPAINDMIDITSTRMAAARMHPPALIYVMLLVLMLTGSLLAGFGMAGRRRDWFHVLAYVCVMSLAVYVILDFEFPNIGLIRIEGSEQVLMQVRESMGK